MRQNLILRIRQHKLLIIYTIFLALSFLTVLPFWLTMHLYSGPDLQFHLSRIQEVFYNFKNGVFISHIATQTFNQIGDAVVACYPWVWLYLFSGLKFFLSPINAIYFAYVIVIFVTLIISYYSMKWVSASTKIAFCFAILYGLTTYLIMEIINTQFGEFLSYPFIPLAFSGIYQIMFKDYKRWYLLVIGVTGVMYAHAPTTLITIIALLIFYILLFTKQSKGERLIRFIYIGIAAIYSLLLGFIVWGPLAYLTLSQKLMRPAPQSLYADPQNLFNLFNQGITNKGMGLILLLLLVFGFLFIKEMPIIGRYTYWSGIITLFVLSNLFPWNIINHIPLIKGIDSIQSGHRIMPIFLMFIAAFGAYFFTTKFPFHWVSTSLIIVIFSLCLINSFDYSALYSMNITTDQNPFDNQFNRTSQPELSYKATPTHQIPRGDLNLQNYKVNNHDYTNQFPTENGSGTTDYLPTSSVKYIDDLANKIAILNGKKFNISSSSINAGSNMINYHLLIPMTKNTNLDLPFIHYKGMIYTIKFNGHTLKHPMTSNRGTLEIKIPQNVRSAQISIQSHGSKFNNFFIVTSVLSWLVLLGYIILKKDRDRVRL